MSKTFKLKILIRELSSAEMKMLKTFKLKTRVRKSSFADDVNEKEFSRFRNAYEN